LFHFCALRADAHAQYEIRVYADAILDMVKDWVPAAYDAFRDYRLGAVTFSAQMVAVLKRMLGGESVGQAESGLSKREWGEMMGALGK
jgi:thymidylate synthase (FAD)